MIIMIGYDLVDGFKELSGEGANVSYLVISDEID